MVDQPIATGFHGISDLGKADNQRDQKHPIVLWNPVTLENLLYLKL